MREGDDDALARARRSAASSLSASARPRAAIAGRCASKANGWTAGTGRAPSSRRATSRMPSSSQTRRTASGWKTRSGGRSSGGTRSVRNRGSIRRIFAAAYGLRTIQASVHPRFLNVVNVSGGAGDQPRVFTPADTFPNQFPGGSGASMVAINVPPCSDFISVRHSRYRGMTTRRLDISLATVVKP